MNKLKVLDLRGNRLTELAELKILTGFGKLEKLSMDVKHATNPMCKNKN